ncbi:hypothetical protein TNCV_4260031 [Trichonephila clavipes]|nr:hypothetical protein TNCV_4260031 [Trichonephila clavipes]
MDIKQYNFINFSRLTLQGVASKNSYLIHFHAGIQKTRNFWNVLPVGFSTKTRSLTAAPVKDASFGTGSDSLRFSGSSSFIEVPKQIAETKAIINVINKRTLSVSCGLFSQLFTPTPATPTKRQVMSPT